MSPLGKSDHVCVSFKWETETQAKNCKRIVYLYEEDYNKLNRILSISWNEYLEIQDIDVMWIKFSEKLHEVIDECIPHREFNGENTNKKDNSQLTNK